MNFWLAILGIAVVAATMIDALRVTMQLGRNGTLSMITARFTWKIFTLLPDTRQRHLELFAGPASLTAAVAAWVGGLWIGWWLIFVSAPDFVLESSTGVPADLTTRFYFTGYNLVTLGLGDYRPGNDFAQICAVLAATTGFFVFTLAISYAAPVLNAVVENRHLAGRITALGKTGDEILVNSWEGDGFGKLDQHLIDITSALLMTARRFLGYPILHFFHTRDRSMSLALSLSALHDALLLLEHAIDQSARPGKSVLGPLRETFEGICRGERIQFATEAEDDPPLPTVDLLSEAGIPVVSQETFEESVQGRAEDRRTLLGFIRDRGWSWDDLRAAD